MADALPSDPSSAMPDMPARATSPESSPRDFDSAGQVHAEQLQLALDAAKLGLWQWTLATGRVTYSEAIERVLGIGRAQLGDDIDRARRLVHPDDVEVVWAADAAFRAGKPFHAEYRMMLPDGRVVWVAIHARTECDSAGRPVRMIGTMADITERKQADASLRNAHDEAEAQVHERTAALALANTKLSNEVEERRAAELQVRELLGLVVDAEEEERRRLSRELHDTVGQHLTAISLALKAIQDHPALPATLQPHIAHVQTLAQALDQDIDRLSHELRPVALDDLGLADALKQHVRAWSADTGLATDLHMHGLSGRRFDPVVETTVYRMVQEALTNVLRHAQASHISVFAEFRAGELRALVEDDGRGMQHPPVADGDGPRRPGLGLRGMAERAALVGGRVEIESEAGRTTVYLVIPCQLA